MSHSLNEVKMLKNEEERRGDERLWIEMQLLEFKFVGVEFRALINPEPDSVELRLLEMKIS